MKGPFGTFPPPTGSLDVVTRAYAEANFAASGSGGGSALEVQITGSIVTASGSILNFSGSGVDVFNEGGVTKIEIQGLSGSAGDYLLARLSADQTATLTASEAFDFNTEVVQRGDLTVDSVTNVGRFSGLKADRTYELSAMVRQIGTGGAITFSWFDLTANAWIGTAGINNTPSHSSTAGDATATAIFAPSVDSELELRCTDGTTANIDAEYPGSAVPSTWAKIVEIGIGRSGSQGPAGTSGANTIKVENTGSEETAAAFSMNFSGSGGIVTSVAFTNNTASIDISGTIGGGGSALEVQNTGSTVTASGSILNFSGSGVDVFNEGGVTKINIPAIDTNIAAAQGDYLQASLTSNHVDPAVATAIDFDLLRTSRGDLSIDGAGKLSGLKAGRTYVIEAGIGAVDDGVGSIEWELYNVTAAASIPGTLSFSLCEGGSSVFTRSPNISTTVITPTVDTEIEVRVTENSSDADVRADVSYLRVFEIGVVQADVVGGLEFMDMISVTVATSSVSFGADGDGIYQRALDGDVDEEYFCSYYMPGDHGGSTFSWVMRPNGASTSQQCAIDYSGGSSGKITAANLTLADQFVARDVRGEFTLYATTGRFRAYKNTSIVSAPGGGSSEMHQSRNAGTWDEQDTNITSIEFAHTDGALDYILTGSQFILWRRTPNNFRADSAAVYERHTMETVDPAVNATVERTTGHTVYGGSIVGISARVEDGVTAGHISASVKVDGTTALTAILDTTNSGSHVVRAPIGQHTFAADKNISVEFLPTGYDNAGSTPSPVTVQLHLTNDGLITQNDRVVDRTELSADATTISLAGLNGDLDKEYEIVGRIKMASTSACDISFHPNGIATDLKCRYSFDAGATSAPADGIVISLAGVSVAVEWSFRTRFWVDRETSQRSFETTGLITYNTTVIGTYQCAGVLLNETSNITTLDIVNSVATNFLAGSWAEIRRVKA